MKKLNLRKLPIQWKTSLATSIYILILLFGSIFLTALGFEKKLINEKNISTIENIKSIIDSYIDSFVLRQMDKLDEMIQKIKENKAVENVKILDIDGKIIGSSNIKELGNLDRSTLTKFLSKGNISFIENENEKTYFFYPVKIDNEPIGYVVSIYNQNMIKKSADKEIMSVIFQTGSIAIFVIIASFLGTFFITGLIIRPIKELKDKLIGISTDDFQYKNILNKPLKKEKDKKCTKSISEECWIVAENPEKILENIGGLSIKECSKCEKFHSLAKDEIEELSFSFYMMTASLKDFLKKLEEAHKERETLNCMAAMGEMSAKIAHEVKNSLYAIGNAASYLKHSIDNEIVKEFSSVIKEEVNRLNEMTITFLNFSKLIEPNFKLNNLNTEIKRTLNLLKDDFEEENIKTITNLGEIPDFEFDKNMIKQVLFNLLLNSIDAIKEKGDKERYIKISTYQKEEKGKRFVILEIEDNGIGIKEENKEKIFKPFFTTKQKGTGLGLPMVYKIIYSHKGIINMHSEYGKGTKFTIIFKIKGG